MGSLAILFHIIFGLLITLVVAFEATLDENQTLQLLYQGIAYQKENKIEKAIETYNTVLKYHPTQPDALHLSGISHHYIGGRALSNLVDKNTVSPNLLLRYWKNSETAESLVRKAIAMKPNDTNFYNTLGEILRANYNNKPKEKRNASRIQEAINIYSRGVDILLPGFLDQIKFNPRRDLLLYERFEKDTLKEVQFDPRVAKRVNDLVHNFAMCLTHSGDNYLDYSILVHERLIMLEPNDSALQFNLALNIRRKKQDIENDRAYTIFEYIVKNNPNSIEAKMQLAITRQLQSRLGDAIAIYNDIVKTRNDGKNVVNMDEDILSNMDDVIRQTILVNLGAAHQESGNFDKAIYLYKRNLQELPNDPRAWNNLGSSLWQIGDAKGSVDAYLKAIAIEPRSGEALVNLGVAYYEYGNVEECKESYMKAYEITKSDGLLMRIATLTLPIMESQESIIQDRSRFKKAIMALYHRIAQGIEPVYLHEPVKDIERVHFYYVYHGENEIFNQIMMANLYFNSASHVLPFVSNFLRDNVPHPTENKLGKTIPHHTLRPHILPERDGKIVVGFISKFFVINHSHGQLLEGIIRLLDRSIFYVVALVIPNPQNHILPSIEASADFIVRLPFALKEVRSTISDLMLDILVFADMLSEPLTYFMGLGSRMAPVQCLFWGNPVTSGTPDNIDYFITGEWMETEGMGGSHDTYDPRSEKVYTNQSSTKIPTQYTEQTVRLRGQGIWYDRIPVPSNVNMPNSFETVSNEDMVWPWQKVEGTVTFVCAQSLFKLHPDYDIIIRDILKRTPNSHLVLLRGRRPTWTEMVQNRLKKAMPSNIYQRIHFTPRVGNSNDYLRILGRADIILHPFPFGGSKTSADAILLNKPTVVLVTDKLRCRMAYSFFVTMGIYETIVYTEDDYVQKAVDLGLDKSLREKISARMHENSPKIWERLEVVDAWARFFQRAYRSSAYGGTNQYVYRERLQGKRNGWNGAIISSTNKLPQPPKSSFKVGNKTPSRREKTTREQDSVLSSEEMIVREWNEKALRAFQRGDTKGAEIYFRKILQVNPLNPYVRNDLAAVLKQQRRLKEAEYQFSRAISLKPDYVTAMANLGVIRHEMNNFEGAKEMYELVLAVDPGNLNVLFNLGNYYRDTKQLENAVHLYKKYLALDYKGNSIVTLFALTSLDNHMNYAFNIIQGYLERREVINNDINFFDEVSRLSKTSYNEAANNLARYSQDSGAFDVQYSPYGLPEIIGEILNATKYFEVLDKRSLNEGASFSTKRLHIVVQYFQTADKQRQEEINTVLFFNLLNPYIYKIHIFVENNNRNWQDFFVNLFADAVYQSGEDPNKARNILESMSYKIQVVHTAGARLRYDMAIKYSFDYIYKGSYTRAENAKKSNDLVVLANADIMFDRSIWMVQAITPDEVYALLRWELPNLHQEMRRLLPGKGREILGDHSGDTSWSCFQNLRSSLQCLESLEKKLKIRIDQQDAWVFHSNVLEKISDIELYQFELGRPRCDTRFARILTEENLSVRNPAFEIRSLHLQRTSARKYTNNDQVPGALKYTPLTFLTRYPS